MNRYQQCCFAFQNVPGGIYAPTPSRPTALPAQHVDLWRRLISEELAEWQAATDIVAQSHEQCDLIYVLYGVACWQGLVIPGYVECVPFIQTYGDPSPYVNDAIESVLIGLDGLSAWYQLALWRAIGLLHSNPPERVSLWPVFQEVHNANMRKMENGIIRSEGGKVLKPEGWQPANIAHVLRAQGLEV